MLAVSSGSLELISLFLEYGADINAQDKASCSYHEIMTVI